MDPEQILESARSAYAQIAASNDPAKELEAAVREHPKGVDQEDYDNLVNNCEGAGLIGQYVSSSLSLLARPNPDADVFYQRLWSVVTSNEMLSDERERVIALFFILVSQALPYFKLTLTRMDKEEFKERREGLSTAIDEVRHITLRDFDQATEEASALLEVIGRQDDSRDRAILMAAYILMHQ